MSKSELKKDINSTSGDIKPRLLPRLLLHTCCAPCFTAAFEALKDKYHITIHWYNPNIYPTDEYKHRLSELLRYSQLVGVSTIVDDDYIISNRSWDIEMAPVNDLPEGGERCERCMMFRLDKTAELAKNSGFDCFATTLTVSPHKNADIINRSGNLLMKKYEIEYIESNFKKNNGFLRSIELSKKFNLYRQNYCGCKVSKMILEQRNQATY